MAKNNRFAEMSNEVHLNHEYQMSRGVERFRQYTKIVSITKETEKAIRFTVTTYIVRNLKPGSTLKEQEQREGHIWAPKKSIQIAGDWLTIEDWLKPDFEEPLVMMAEYTLLPEEPAPVPLEEVLDEMTEAAQALDAALLMIERVSARAEDTAKVDQTYELSDTIADLAVKLKQAASELMERRYQPTA